MATGKPATRAAPALVVLAAAAAEVSAQATNCNIVETYIGVCALAIQKDLSPTFGAVCCKGISQVSGCGCDIREWLVGDGYDVDNMQQVSCIPTADACKSD
jgi:hypothetical protein